MCDLFSASQHPVPRHAKKHFNPDKAIFLNVNMINATLLQDVVDCYRSTKRNVCHSCYYKRCTKVLANANHECKECRRLPQLLLLIPASEMCDNFEGTEDVPINSPPEFLMIPSHWYVMCFFKFECLCKYLKVCMKYFLCLQVSYP